MNLNFKIRKWFVSWLKLTAHSTANFFYIELVSVTNILLPIPKNFYKWRREQKKTKRDDFFFNILFPFTVFLDLFSARHLRSYFPKSVFFSNSLLLSFTLFLACGRWTMGDVEKEKEKPHHFKNFSQPSIKVHFLFSTLDR